SENSPAGINCCRMTALPGDRRTHTLPAPSCRRYRAGRSPAREGAPGEIRPKAGRESRTISLCGLCLRTHLFHKLTHRREISGRAGLNPGLVLFGSFFQMCKVQLTGESLAALLEGRLDALPYTEELAARLEEQVFV